MTTLEARVRVPKDVLFRELDGEAVILNLKTGQYYGLDAVATRMWLSLQEHGDADTAYRALLDQDEVEEERLRGDLLGLIDELTTLQLLEADEA